MKILLPLLLLIATISSSCGKIKEPEFRKVNGFGIKKMGITEIVVGFNTTYYNPNNFGVAVKEAVLDVYVDSVYLGKFAQPQSVSVNPNAEFSIPLEGAIPLAKALQNGVASLIGKEVFIKANGSVKVGKAGVFITNNINYGGRHRLDESLIKNPASTGLIN